MTQSSHVQFLGLGQSPVFMARKKNDQILMSNLQGGQTHGQTNPWPIWLELSCWELAS